MKQYKKIFNFYLIVTFFISCEIGKKENEGFASLMSLIFLKNKDSDSSSSSQESSKPKVKPRPNLNIEDPLYKDQWQLKNTGQYKGKVGIDINVEPVWKLGYDGTGVFIGVLDDPIQASHPDLKDNIPAGNVTDYNKGKPFCDPSDSKKNRNHGNYVAGLIAARDNKIGLRGVAFRSTLYSYGVITRGGDNKKFSQFISQSLKRSEYQKIAVYNGSIGLKPGSYNPITDDLYQSVEQVTQKGFHGKDSSLVFAAGNGNLIRMGNSSLEAWLSNHYAVIAVNSIINTGEKVVNLGGQGGVNLWLVAPSRISGSNVKMYTTNLICANSDPEYDDSMSSTSGAAPMVTGVVALLRQAYPDLTWRDVKLILAESAKKITGGGQSYQKTGNMYSNSQKEQKHGRYSGFGLVDAEGAFEMAESWKLLPSMKTISETQDINLDTRTKDQFHESSLLINNSDLSFIESVTLEVDVSKSEEEVSLVQCDLVLISPDGTESHFFKANGKEKISSIFHDALILKSGVNQFTLISNSFLGNSTINGNWRLKIKQKDAQLDLAKRYNDQIITEIKSWKLTIRGH